MNQISRSDVHVPALGREYASAIRTDSYATICANARNANERAKRRGVSNSKCQSSKVGASGGERFEKRTFNTSISMDPARYGSFQTHGAADFRLCNDIKSAPYDSAPISLGPVDYKSAAAPKIRHESLVAIREPLDRD